MHTLIVAEHDEGALHGATANAVAAGLQFGGEVHVLVAGHHAGDAAAAAACLAGVSKVLLADGVSLAEQLAENVAAQVVSLARGYDQIVFPSTSRGKSVAPRVAAQLDVAQVSDVTRILGADLFERAIYAGNAIATVRSTDTVKVLTVRGTAFEPAASGDGRAPVDSVPVVAELGKTRFVSRSVLKSDRPELASAKVVVSGGRGLGSAENFKALLEPLADKLQAALGASRAAVDAGFAPNDWQVGQTGKIVAPSVYMAIGISGAIQHLAGMKDSKTIVAINKDPEAPIFSIADLGLEADLFSAVPDLTERL